MTAPTPAVLARLDALAPGELPAYVYDLAALRTHAAAVRAALPAPVELYYAAKANPEPAVLAALAPYVDGYEVSSGGELAHVAAAVPGRRLAFGAPGKTPDELAAGRAAGVHRVHVESLHELRVLGAQTADAAPDAGTDVLLRVNLPVADGSLAGSALDMGGRPSPFGLDPADAGEAARLLAGARTRGCGCAACTRTWPAGWTRRGCSAWRARWWPGRCGSPGGPGSARRAWRSTSAAAWPSTTPIPRAGSTGARTAAASRSWPWRTPV